MQTVCDFLKKCGTYYLGTDEGGQPRVRPFGTAEILDGKLCIQTGRSKPVARQIFANSKIEICAFDGKSWVRIQAEAAEYDSIEAQTKMLDAYPNLKDRYTPGDGNMLLLALQNATATFSAFGGEEKIVKF